MAAAKAHHYVPRYYLLGFTAPPDCRLLHAYEKGSQRVFQTTPDRVAYEKHFYTIDREDRTRDSATVEQYLAEQIEVPANPVLRKIRERQMITDVDKDALAAYLAVMLKRVPRHRQKLHEIFPEVRTKLAEQIDTELGDAAAARPAHARYIEERRREAQAILTEYEKSVPSEIIVGQINTRLAPIFKKMTWQFLTTTGGHGFLTSDNPVYFHEGLGLAHQLAEVTFPISTTVALWATWRTDLPEGFVRTTAQVVDEINRRAVNVASRWVFHARRRRWIITLVNRSSHELNRLI